MGAHIVSAASPDLHAMRKRLKYAASDAARDARHLARQTASGSWNINKVMAAGKMW